MNSNNNPLTELITNMIADRRNYIAANGITATDDDIADSIKAALIRMMKEA